MEGEIDVDWISGGEIVFDVLNDQLDQIIALVEQHRNEQVPNLLFRVLVRAQQIHRFNMSKVDVMSEQENEEQLADVLLLVIPVQCLVALELAANIGQFFIDAFRLGLFHFQLHKKNKKKLFQTSFDLQFRMSEMNTARPRIPSLATAGIAVLSLKAFFL